MGFNKIKDVKDANNLKKDYIMLHIIKSPKLFYVIMFALFLPCSSYSKELSFTLIDSDCKMLGPRNSKIDVNNRATKVKSYCKEESSNKLTCSTIDPVTDKFISSHTYKIATERNKKGAPSLLIGTSKSGNIQLTINFKDKTHQWGQVNFLASGTIVVTKYCIGKVYLK